jgi:hypothetical protein
VDQEEVSGININGLKITSDYYSVQRRREGRDTECDQPGCSGPVWWWQNEASASGGTLFGLKKRI